jgi:hypothetical protein
LRGWKYKRSSTLPYAVVICSVLVSFPHSGTCNSGVGVPAGSKSNATNVPIISVFFKSLIICACWIASEKPLVREHHAPFLIPELF